MNSLNTSLSSFMQLFDNAALSWGLLACGLAQLSKLLFEYFRYRHWRPSVLLETGGMPSSHSAFVTGTAAGVGLQLGFDHPSFAVASTIAFVVMYDASGIRRAAGLTAQKVNEITSMNSSLEDSPPLKERLGHTRLEVLVGSLLGPAIALPGIVFIGSPYHLFQMLSLSLG